MSLSTVLKYGLLSQGGEVAPVLPTITWELKSGVSSYNITSVGYGDDIVTLCADRGCSFSNGYVRKSLDWGQNWSDTKTGGPDTCACNYVNGYWTVNNRCGENVYNIHWSNNLDVGNTWTSYKVNGQYHYNSWKAGDYIVNGNYNNYYTYSNDGTTWTSRRITAVSSQSVNNASYSSLFALYYITATNNTYTYNMTALDGTDQAETTPINGYNTVCGDNEVLAFKYNTSSATPIKRCDVDGLTFGETITAIPTYTNIAGIEFFDGIYIMTFYDSSDSTRRVALSTDGTTWTESAVPSGCPQPYQGNTRIACGYNSSDGKNYIFVNSAWSTTLLIGNYTA